MHDKLASLIAKRKNSKVNTQEEGDNKDDDENVGENVVNGGKSLEGRITPAGSDDEEDGDNEDDDDNEDEDDGEEEECLDFMSRLARDNLKREKRAAEREREASKKFTFKPDIKVGSSKKSLKKVKTPYIF